MKNRAEEMLFDIHYRTSNDDIGSIVGITKYGVEYELDNLFKDESMFWIGVTKNNSEDIIFSHSVLVGTTIYEKDYKAPSTKPRGCGIIKFGVDGERLVNSKYPRWEYRVFDVVDGELDIDRLLSKIK